MSPGAGVGPASAISRSGPPETRLDKFPLVKGCVAGVGDARIAQLASFGIESAADIDEDDVMAIPGFGQHLSAALLAWRQGLEKRFRFNPSQPVPAAELRRLQVELKKPLEDYRKEVLRLAAM